LDTLHNYSPEDLILYLYKETSQDASEAIEEALKTDWTLREKLEVLQASMKRLDSIITSPRIELILNVMKYAAKEPEVSKVKS
jgi:hypothetical protein